MGDVQEADEAAGPYTFIPGRRYDRIQQCKAEFDDNYLPCHGADFDPNNGTQNEYRSSFQARKHEYASKCRSLEILLLLGKKVKAEIFC